LETVSARGIRLECDPAAVPHAKALLASLTVAPKDNLRIPLGFAHLILREEDGVFVAHEPNYATNPVIALRKDVTTTLALAADMLAVAHKYGVEPQFPHFMDQVRVSEGFLHAPRLVLSRTDHWQIAPAGCEPNRSVRTYELLASRPLLLTALALPAPRTLVLDRDHFA
jgi:hypothetical protein